MLDHISLRVTDYAVSKAFYQAALTPLGYSLAMETPTGAGFAKGPIPSFWVKAGSPPNPIAPAEGALEGCGGAAIHVALAADSRAIVDAFYQAAVAAGGRANGAPRLCLEYHGNYYGAFVLDPDGYNIEAVCHRRP